MTLELFVQRKSSAAKATLGELFVNGSTDHYCVTLEDMVRDLKDDGSGKIQNETAIGPGRYKVIIDFSQRFQKPMLHVLDVKWFTGIRIHSGNTDKNTEGCILVGSEVMGTDYIHGGSQVLPALFALVKNALDNGQECFLTVANTPAPLAGPTPSNAPERGL